LWFELNNFRYDEVLRPLLEYGFDNFEIHINVVLEISDILLNWGVPRPKLRCQESILQEYFYYFLIRNVGLWIK
jgi:hypothetical protein